MQKANNCNISGESVLLVHQLQERALDSFLAEFLRAEDILNDEDITANAELISSHENAMLAVHSP